MSLKQLQTISQLEARMACSGNLIRDDLPKVTVVMPVWVTAMILTNPVSPRAAAYLAEQIMLRD